MRRIVGRNWAFFSWSPWPVLDLIRLSPSGAAAGPRKSTMKIRNISPLSTEHSPASHFKDGQFEKQQEAASLECGQRYAHNGDCDEQEGEWAFVKPKYWEKEEFYKG